MAIAIGIGISPVLLDTGGAVVAAGGGVVDNWILATGVWNDSGVWEDDDVWKDS